MFAKKCTDYKNLQYTVSDVQVPGGDEPDSVLFSPIKRDQCKISDISVRDHTHNR